MKKFLVITFVNILLVLLQSSFLRELVGPSNTPNLVLAFSFSLFFMDFEDMSLMSAFIGGLFLDFFGFSIVGLTPLIITGSLLLFTFVKRYLFRGWVSNVLLVFLAQIIYLGMISGVFSLNPPALYSATSTLLLSLVFYFINKSFSGFYGTSGYKFLNE